jgi:hypothetical protein
LENIVTTVLMNIMMVCGIRVWNGDKVKLNMHMEKFTKEISRMIKEMVLESWDSVMVQGLKDNGLMIN